MRHDAEYLLDIRDAAKYILSWVTGVEKDEFNSDKLLQSAVLFQLMIVGEAATGLSDDLRSRYPNVEWKSLRGFRNIIVHSYFRISIPIVWSAAINDSKLLIEAVENILAAEFPITLSDSDD